VQQTHHLADLVQQLQFRIGNNARRTFPRFRLSAVSARENPLTLGMLIHKFPPHEEDPVPRNVFPRNTE
jgi:hypothetical protein